MLRLRSVGTVLAQDAGPSGTFYAFKTLPMNRVSSILRKIGSKSLVWVCVLISTVFPGILELFWTNRNHFQAPVIPGYEQKCLKTC